MNSPNKLDDFHKVIKNFKEYFPKTFEKTEIKVCGHCGGTGLKSKYILDEYCTYCSGIGFTNVLETEQQYICKKCKGSGHQSRTITCTNCKGEGLVDWITNAMIYK